MPFNFFEIPLHPNRIAVTELDSYVEGGAFFLDFTRPLELRRRLLVPVSLFVPIVHEGEVEGRYVLGVHRSETCFAELRRLWNIHYPAEKILPPVIADGLKIIADFGRQFPTQC